jgi:hypothetical protein
MFQIKFVEKIEPHVLCSRQFCFILPFMRLRGKMFQSEAGHRRQYGARALHSGYLRLQTHTHTQYVILIAFLLQQWLQESTSMAHYTYIICLVCITYNVNFPISGQESRVTGTPSHHTARTTEGLTAWSRVLLEKLTGSQIVKKFPAFEGNRRFITVFTSDCHLSLS